MSEKHKDEIYLRNYPKVIFLYPLVFTSLILWILQLFTTTDEPILGYIWFMVFFCNIFVMSFDFSSTKFFVLVLAIVVIILLIIFLVLPNLSLPTVPTGIQFNLGLPDEFYMSMTLILAIILGIVILDSYFDFWKIERNEIYHKSGLFSSAERIPTKSLRLKTEITDVFEYFVLRAGSITLMPGRGEVIHLPTVPNIKKKQEQIDYLLSHVSVEPDEVDQ